MEQRKEPTNKHTGVGNENLTPDGFHSLNYARHLIEESIGWPVKGNLEMVAECLTSISKTKGLSLHRAHDYMARAIRLAKEQGVKVDHYFFQKGVYMEMRPKPVDRYKHEEHLAARWREHGCKSGWVYVDGGVKRCPECAKGPIE